jgi:TonB family protein
MNLPKFLLISLVVLLVTAVSIFVVAFINNVESVWEKSSNDLSEILSDSLSESSSESLPDSLLVVTTEETETTVLQEKSGSEQIKNTNSTSPQNNLSESNDGITIEDLNENQTAGGAEKSKIEDEILEVAEQDAQYPGGQAALLKYIRENTKYPAIALEQDVQGMVILRFVVERDGRVGDIEVKKSLSVECDREAIRVIKSLPRFVPARKEGRPVRKWFTVPVRFMIQ